MYVAVEVKNRAFGSLCSNLSQCKIVIMKS